MENEIGKHSRWLPTKGPLNLLLSVPELAVKSLPEFRLLYFGLSLVI